MTISAGIYLWPSSSRNLDFLPDVLSNNSNSQEKVASPVDINTADSLALVQLPGIGPAFAKRIIAYRQALGGYDSVGQLRKVYGLPPETFQRIAPMCFASTRQKRRNNASVASFTLDLNTADSAQLTRLRGIGPVLAARIVKYRAKAAGFDSLPQLKRIYGLSPETYSHILPQLTLSPKLSPPNSSRQRASIPLNTADTSLLKTLPGIGNTLATRIVKYRNKLGGFDSVAQLKRIYGLSPETYTRISAMCVIHQAPTRSVKAAPQVVDLNTSTAAELEALPGIGPKLAQKILFLRNQLGFIAYSDLVTSIWGFSEENYALAAPYLHGESLGPPTIPLNLAEWNDLAKLSFLPSKTRKALLKKRSQIGQFHTWAQVAEIEGMTPDRVRWLQAYAMLGME